MKCFAALLLALLLRQPPAWQLDDQFGRAHSAAELAGRPVLLIAGGAPAAKTFDAWIDAVLRAYAGLPDSSAAPTSSPLPFVVLSIADVGNAPRVLHPIIRWRLPRNRSRPVLVDPNGTVSRQYQIERATSNQLVLGRDGRVLLHLRGIPVDSAGVRLLVEQLRLAVRSAATEPAR